MSFLEPTCAEVMDQLIAGPTSELQLQEVGKRVSALCGATSFAWWCGRVVPPRPILLGGDFVGWEVPPSELLALDGGATLNWAGHRFFAFRCSESRSIWLFGGIPPEAEPALRRACTMISALWERLMLRRELERSRALESTLREQLEHNDQMASLGSLLAGVAHELNTPIGALTSMHDSVMRAVAKIRDSAPEERLERAFRAIDQGDQVIRTAVSRVAEMASRLRSFSRSESATLSSWDVRQGIDEAISLLAHQMEGRIALTRLYANVPPVMCYPNRLRQVFLNLLGNAVQAIEGKGEIHVEAYVRDGQVVVSIQDNGSGIPTELRERVFTPGFTTKAENGTGLGLVICARIMHEHRGKIWFEPCEPGTKFVVNFPVGLGQNTEAGGVECPYC